MIRIIRENTRNKITATVIEVMRWFLIFESIDCSFSCIFDWRSSLAYDDLSMLSIGM